MVADLWSAALLSAVWFVAPLLLVAAVTGRRTTRIVFGAVLGAALVFLFAVLVEALVGDGMPNPIEGLILWGPTTLVIAGLAFVADRRLPPRQEPTTPPAAPGPEQGRAARMLAAGFVVWSALGICCIGSPLAELLDLRFRSPTPAMVLPLPSDLTLISMDESCGSETCSVTYLIGSPDQADQQELTERLWTHLVGDKGWERIREDAGCQRRGWFIHREFCLFTREAGSVDALRVHVTGSAARPTSSARP